MRVAVAELILDGFDRSSDETGIWIAAVDHRHRQAVSRIEDDDVFSLLWRVGFEATLDKLGHGLWRK